jgi:hypothetical protein
VTKSHFRKIAEKRVAARRFFYSKKELPPGWAAIPK